MILRILILGFFLSATQVLATESELQGRIGTYGSYFTNQHRIRQERLQFTLKNKVTYSPNWNSVLEASGLFDFALINNNSFPQRELPKSVRHDEMFDFVIRNLYWDYLGETFRFKGGYQQIDWTETLSPNTSTIITPLDLRYGGFGNASDNIISVLAASVNHPVPHGTLEWLMIPIPKTHRYPKAENGFGTFPSLRLPNEKVTNDGISNDAKEVEAGVRYLFAGNSWDFTWLAFYGHERTPIAEITPTMTDIENDLVYPRSFITGFFTSHSHESMVLRFSALYQPKRQMSLQVQNTEPSFKDEGIYRNRLRIGAGLDYVFSKHLKFYSEYFFDTNKVVGKKDLAPTATPPAIKAIESASYKADGQNNLQMVFRFTNETFDNLLLQANFIQFAPKKAHIIGAQATYTYNVNYKIGLGARWIESNDKESPIERLKDSSLVYASLDYYFDTAK